jgi:hypothetical protein
VLSFIDCQLFNQLLLRPECCCTSNARYVTAGVKLLDQWLVAGDGGVEVEGTPHVEGGLHATAHALLRPLYNELRHVRQVRQGVQRPQPLPVLQA